jgi:hypothetical protein
MILFYPPQPTCTPVVIADMTDSSDRWSVAEIWVQALLNMPDGVVAINQPSVYSCKYNYGLQHNGVPLGAALKMTLDATVSSPPAGLVAQVSIDYVSSAQSVDRMSDALVKFANPEFKVMTAVVIERAGSSIIHRSFLAFSVILQPDTYGTNTTLIIRAASFDDMLIKSELAYQFDTTRPLSVQLSELAAKADYTCTFDASFGSYLVPVSGRLFPPSTLPKILDEICLQNKIIYKITVVNTYKIISFYSQNAAPEAATVAESNYKFSFLGHVGALLWGVGVENYANVKFKTPIFDAVLFDKITIYNDSQSALFQGFKKSGVRVGKAIPDSYDVHIIRYAMARSDSELCCEVTATNNWLLAQTRIDGILESKIFSGAL